MAPVIAAGLVSGRGAAGGMRRDSSFPPAGRNRRYRPDFACGADAARPIHRDWAYSFCKERKT